MTSRSRGGAGEQLGHIRVELLEENKSITNNDLHDSGVNIISINHSHPLDLDKVRLLLEEILWDKKYDMDLYCCKDVLSIFNSVKIHSLITKVNKAFETARTGKLLGSSMEANVYPHSFDDSLAKRLRNISGKTIRLDGLGHMSQPGLDGNESHWFGVVYESLLSADSINRAWEILDQISGRGTAAYSHSQKVASPPHHPPSMHATDLLASSAKKAQDFLPFLQRNRRMTAVVEYLLCGHRCPGRDEPYSNDAISLIRHKIMQRDVEIKVETVCRTGTFIGSLCESITNVGAILLEVGLAELQTRFGADRIADAHLLQCQNLANKHFICEGCHSYCLGSHRTTTVQVSMEYSQKVHVADGFAAPAGSADSRVMGFGSVFLLSKAKGSKDVNSTTATPLAAATQHISNTIVLSEIKEENFKRHGDQLGNVVSNSMKTNLSLELKRLASPRSELDASNMLILFLYRRILIVWLNTLKYRTINSCRESTLDMDVVEYQPFQLVAEQL
ncbi:ribonuclease TUDOR 1-like protein [Tanacetum coccineum]|uniref:Ribonuclease TUDOR 1-like protein n=1 Tax=Tanacetum coccineum TaxID=301880 RepID=A0ABQ5EX90_9ASTR